MDAWLFLLLASEQDIILGFVDLDKIFSSEHQDSHIKHAPTWIEKSIIAFFE